MRIQHNIMSMNAYRNYNNNANALSKNLEKLSSGYKINRAGDDAAGLAISEKMRAQIKGLDAAQKNVKDGISLVKTAEGAMQEIQDMLSRMKYLATQSSNGTYDDAVDRKALQDEVNSLRNEINRIAETANFNGTKLLDGSLAGAGAADDAKSFTAAPETANEATLSAAGLTGTTITGLTDAIKSVEITTAVATASSNDDGSATASIDANGKLSITVTGKDGTGTEVTVDDINNAIKTAITNAVTAGDLTQEQADALDGVALETTIGTITADGPVELKVGEADDTAAAEGPTFTGDDTGLAAFGVTDIDVSEAGLELTEETSVKASFDQASKKLTVTIGDKTFEKTFGNTGEDANDIKGTEVELQDADGNKVKLTMDATAANVKVGGDQTTDIAEAEIGKLTPADTNTTGKQMTLHIGDDATTDNQLKFSIGDMHTSAMTGANSKGKSIADISIEKIDSAFEALNVIKDAINYVSGIRGELGAIQNRLEHTQNNLSVMHENIQDAESTIRDTDVADEMMAYTKNNILIQSAQAMLAQANAVPQGVLQLLQ